MLDKFVTVLIGLQWGDEGKGKYLAQIVEDFDAIVRFNGGHNAGHSLESNGQKMITHILPSGVFSDKELWIGGNVIVCPIQFMKEINEAESKGLSVKERVYIDHRAILSSPLDRFIDAAEEYVKSTSGKQVGTTLRGIGPAYVNDTGRIGLRFNDLISINFEDKINNLLSYQVDLLENWYNKKGYSLDTNNIRKSINEWYEAIKSLNKDCVVDLTKRSLEFAEAKKKILAEGAQAYMLDRVLGDYPNVTSSNTVPAAVCISLGLPTTSIKEVIGVSKFYTTKVGEGYFPSEMPSDLSSVWREAGYEFGASTGRPRRCGYLDLHLLTKAIKATGATKIFFTKADICPTEKIKVVISYKKDYFSLSEISEKDIFVKEFEGWKDWDPKEEKNNLNFEMFINFLDNFFLENIGPEIKIVGYGTGPDKDDLVLL